MSATIRDRAARALQVREQQSLTYPHIQADRADFANRTRACEAMLHLIDVDVDPKEWKPQGEVTDVLRMPDYRLNIEGLTFLWSKRLNGASRDLCLVSRCSICEQEHTSKPIGSLHHLGHILDNEANSCPRCGVTRIGKKAS